jgi:serine/threonine-protein kinase HipA
MDEYLDDANASPVSISLPLQREFFSAGQTRQFFEGLLPEGFTRRSVAQWLHLDENDYLSILHQLGRECLGAIRVLKEGETQAASYEMITRQQVKALAEEGAQKSAEIVTKSHLSLTGASGKVGLYYDMAGNQWYLPQGTAPSTHIVKQSHVRLEGIVTNEQLSMMTAAKCGIEVPESFIIDLGSGEDKEVLYATRRYDRTFEGAVDTINGLMCPLRLHQEDFSQAIGIPSTSKYEKERSGYMRRMFELLRQFSTNPIVDQQKLWDLIVFCFCLGNTDAHIKNFSLLYGKDLRSIRLAPAYDLVSTTVYESSTREMSFFIGNALSIDEITEASFREAAAEIHIGERFAARRYNFICNHFRAALREAADELQEAGFSKAE